MCGTYFWTLLFALAGNRSHDERRQPIASKKKCLPVDLVLHMRVHQGVLDSVALHMIWSNYSDLTRPHPKNSAEEGKSTYFKEI